MLIWTRDTTLRTRFNSHLSATAIPLGVSGIALSGRSFGSSEATLWS